MTTTIKITAEYHDIYGFDKIYSRNFFFDDHYIILQPTNSLAKKAKIVCSLLMSVKYGQVAEPLLLHCEIEPGFQSSS